VPRSCDFVELEELRRLAGRLPRLSRSEATFESGLKLSGLRFGAKRKAYALLVPGGFLDAVNKMNAPAERMEIPTDHDTVTYANGDLTDTIKLFEQYGVRFLTADELHTTMPEYPLSPKSESRGSGL
jgi:hypothetical protein